MPCLSRVRGESELGAQNFVKFLFKTRFYIFFKGDLPDFACSNSSRFLPNTAGEW